MRNNQKNAQRAAATPIREVRKLMHPSTRRIATRSSAGLATLAGVILILGSGHGADASAPAETIRSTPTAIEFVVAPTAATLDTPPEPAAAPVASPETTVAPPTTIPPTTIPAAAPPPPPARPAVAPAPAPVATTTPPPPPPAPAPTPAPAPQPAPSRSAAASQCQSDLARWINEARAAHGVGGLTNDTGISSIPIRWSDTMAQRQNLAHNPDYANQVFGARPAATTVAENVGRAAGSNRSLFDAFMGSPGHRANILGRQFSHVTVGCAIDANGHTWATMNFWG